MRLAPAPIRPDVRSRTPVAPAAIGSAPRRPGLAPGAAGARRHGPVPRRRHSVLIGDVAYRLKVPFEDAVALKPQRTTLADGKTIDLELAESNIPGGVDVPPEGGVRRRVVFATTTVRSSFAGDVWF